MNIELSKAFRKYSLETKILNKEVIPNIVISIYILLNTTALIAENNKTSSIIIMWSLMIYGIILLMAGPLINKMVCYKTSNALNYWISSTLDDDERTELIEKMHKLPRAKSIQVSLLFTFPTIIISILMYFNIGLTLLDTIIYLLSTYLVSYFGGIIIFYTTENLITPIIYEIAKQGVNEEIIFKRKIIGIPLNIIFLVFLIFPIILSNTLMICAIIKCYTENITNCYFVIVCATSNTIIITISIVLYFKSIQKNSRQMSKALALIDKKNVSTINEPFPVDFANHISYSQYLTNTTLSLLQNLLENYRKSNKDIHSICEDLYEVSSKTQSTIIEQSTSVEEINATINNTNNLASIIENKINEVINIANKTLDSVKENGEALDINLQVMKEISQENKKMIKGIEFLYSKINSVWETVNLIDSITEQTKIIAFNAELEANILAKDNSQLSNVSQEIRSMANKTLELTKNIKDQIRNIKNCSKALIETGKNCMDKIQDGYDIAANLHDKFKSITLSSQSTAADSEKIKIAISEQADSMEDISQILIEIDDGAREFTESTKKISETIDTLKKNSTELHNISKEYYGERSEYDI